MKKIIIEKKLILIFIALLYCLNSVSQTTIILQPNADDGKDAIISSLESSMNYGWHPDFDAFSWTAGGNKVTFRSLLYFDLSMIPPDVYISSATLSLYNNSTSGNCYGEHSSMNGSNISWLQRIMEDWDENTVTWNNQPAITTMNQVTVSESSYPCQNYPNINVTDLVKDMIDDPSTSFGFLYRLQTEEYYRSMIFASSDHTDTTLHPKLTIIFEENLPNDTCITIQPNADDGKDVIISSLEDSMNYGWHPDFDAFSWTAGGNLVTFRSLLDFDLSFIPPDVYISSATLSLYNNSTSGNCYGEHSSLDGSNISWLQRITEDWDENTVTWNNQPAITTMNQVTVSESSCSTQDYPNINVTDLVKDMIDYPSTSFGFLYRLQTEEYYRSMIFASSDHTDTTLHPKLEICYLIPVGINHLNSKNNIFNVYPNPTNDIINIELNIDEDATIKILNIYGQTICTKDIKNRIGRVSVSDYPNGIYIIKLISINIQQSKRIIKY